MKIALGSDHGGYALKLAIKEHLEKAGHQITDVGSHDANRAEYPFYGEKAARLVAAGECELGVLVCGTGCGISLSANRVRGIRCSNCSEPVTARLSREHNNCNMIALGGRIVGEQMALEIVDSFLNARFITGGRHEERVKMIEAIDRD